MAFWGAIATGGAMLLNSIMQRRQSKQNTMNTLDANKALADYQYGKDVEMWNLQNEYNLPSNQRQRLEDAGYNPALLYGSGGMQNTASAMPKYSDVRHEANVTPVQIPDTIGKYVDLEIKTAQADLLKKNAELTAAKEQSERIGQEIARSKADMMSIDLQYKPQMSEYNLEHKKKFVELTDKKIAGAIEDLILKKGDQKLKAQVLKNKKGEQYNIWLRNEYQKAVNDLLKKGITPNDNVILRQIAINLKDMGDAAKEFFEDIPKKYQKYKESKSAKGAGRLKGR